jgi:hypothetical protein
MKYLGSFLLVNIFLFTINPCVAQSTKLKTVQVAVDKLKAAMISGVRAELEMITSDQLSYGHSGGHVEGKSEFIEKLVSGKSDFVSIDVTDQTINIKGKTAIVRHYLNAVTNDNGKSGNVKLFILLVFSKEQGHWRLFARQALKA